MNRYRFPAALLPIVAVFFMASSPAEALSRPPETITIRGTVKIFGNMPHTYVGIRTEDESKTYAVYPPEKEKELKDLQGRLIEFTVILLDKPAGEGSLYLKDGTVTPVSWKIVN